jgi:hypothetical protein
VSGALRPAGEDAPPSAAGGGRRASQRYTGWVS